MKTFKTILKILLVIIFIASAGLNILLFSSSYGTLIFKHNEAKLISMNSYANSRVSADYLMNQKDAGLQIKSTAVVGCDEYIANYYVDKDSKLYAHIACTYTKDGQTVTDNSYFKDNKVYHLHHTGEKAAETMDFKYLFSSQTNSALKNLLVSESKIKNNDEKAKISFSFSPFYFVGIKYSYKDELNTTYKYEYDLSGCLRKINLSNSEGKKEVTITYKSKSISIPTNLD